ncbi:MAG: thioesterase family protein [Burkholderiales bacterium]|nr:thioesterase family protein [Burkholderiales bacterium]
MMQATHGAATGRRSADEQARFEAGLKEMFEQAITFNQVLGLKVLSVQPGDVRGSFEMRPELVGHFAYGRLHGGVTSSVLDAIGGLALMVAIAERHPADDAMQAMARFVRLGTIDLRIDFLRQGLGRHFVASAEVTRLGGRVGSTQMRLVNDEGEVIATGAAAYIVS